jgi:hypothetical protein
MSHATMLPAAFVEIVQLEFARMLLLVKVLTPSENENSGGAIMDALDKFEGSGVESVKLPSTLMLVV